MQSPCESYFNEIRFESDAFLGILQCLVVFIRFGIGSRSVTEKNVIGLVERYRFRVETDGFVIFARWEGRVSFRFQIFHLNGSIRARRNIVLRSRNVTCELILLNKMTNVKEETSKKERESRESYSYTVERIVEIFLESFHFFQWIPTKRWFDISLLHIWLVHNATATLHYPFDYHGEHRFHDDEHDDGTRKSLYISKQILLLWRFQILGLSSTWFSCHSALLTQRKAMTLYRLHRRNLKFIDRSGWETVTSHRCSAFRS